MLNYTEILIAVMVSILLIVSGYQVYFLPQRKPLREISVGKVRSLDKIIYFSPIWVWIYSFAYYPYIVSPIYFVKDMMHFFMLCLSYFLLLFFHVFLSYMYPVKTPLEWRQYKAVDASTRMLKFVQSIDRGGNCFPSMHVAVAVLTACHWAVNYPDHLLWVNYIVWFITILISVSTIFTKQHFVLDVPAGFILGASVFGIYQYLIYDYLYRFVAIMYELCFWLQRLI